MVLVFGDGVVSRVSCSRFNTGQWKTFFSLLGLLLLVIPHYPGDASSFDLFPMGLSPKTSSADDLIPEKLLPPERKVYQKLMKRRESHQRPRPVVVITDVGKDYDDLAALVVLTEFHRLGLIDLRLVVANLMPAEKRAWFAKSALVSLGLGDVPVGRGTRGSPADLEEFDHEFKEAEFTRGEFGEFRDGKDLLLEVYQNAKNNNEKLYLLCLSSLQDISEFASHNSDLVAEVTSEVHMQGGITSEGHMQGGISGKDPIWMPDHNAANNRFNLEAAKKWHSFIQEHAIRSHIYNKDAAFAAPLTSNVFQALEATGHPIGAYLRRVQVEQDVAFYKLACVPEKRFAPYMDQEWFLAHKTNWHLRPNPSEGDALPTDEGVIPYLTKIVLYDVLAALGVAGDDVVEKLKIHKELELRSGEKMHYSITDRSVTPEVADTISLEVSSLLKGALLWSNRRFPAQQQVCEPP